MPNVINPNKARIYFSKEGLSLETYNMDKFNPNSNINTIQINIEDGGQENVMAMINYQTANMKFNSQATVSHWYPLAFIGMNNYRIAGETAQRSFAQYLTFVPANVLNANLGKTTPMSITATVKLVGGINFLGLFESVELLEAEHPATVELQEEYAIAGVIDTESGDVVFYTVVYDSEGSVYEWVEEDEETNPLLSLLESKQYNITNMVVQGGLGNATPLPLSTMHYQILWNLLNNQGNSIVSLDEKLDNVLSMFQSTVQSVEDTDSVDLTLTPDLPNGKKLKAEVNVVNDLISTDIKKPVSALQAKLLNDYVSKGGYFFTDDTLWTVIGSISKDPSFLQGSVMLGLDKGINDIAEPQAGILQITSSSNVFTMQWFVKHRDIDLENFAYYDDGTNILILAKDNDSATVWKVKVLMETFSFTMVTPSTTTPYFTLGDGSRDNYTPDGYSIMMLQNNDITVEDTVW